MNKKRKIWGTTAAIAVIVSLLIVSMPAEEKDGADKHSPEIPKEKREWMAQEEEKIKAKMEDPEFKKLLERSHNRKWYSYEELYGKELNEEDKEYMKILDRLEREGIDTSGLFNEIERYIRSTGKKIDKVQFAKDFGRRKLEKRKDTKTPCKECEVCTSGSCVDIDDVTNGGGDIETDLIYYSPWGQFVYVHNNDDIKFYLHDTSYIGLGEWVFLYNGTVYDFTWRNYYDPQSEVNWILNYLWNNYGITRSEVRLIHMKYFIQGSSVYQMYHLEQGWVYLGNRYIELWSEANYYPNSGTWDNHGYPDKSQGGANIIKNHGYAYTSTGNSYYNPYPQCVFRHFGSGSETGIELTLYSHPWHQQAVLS